MYYLFFKLIFIGGQLLYNVVLFSAYNKWNQLYAYTIPSFLDFLPIQVTTEHGIEFPELCRRFSLVICFIHSINSVYGSIPIFLYFQTYHSKSSLCSSGSASEAMIPIDRKRNCITYQMHLWGPHMMSPQDPSPPSHRRVDDTFTCPLSG